MEEAQIFVGHRKIGNDAPCYIIAEMSANHGGDFNRAIEIIHAAKAAGADCVKIQTYTPDTITIDCCNDYFMIKEGTWKGENLYKLYGKAYTPWEWQGRLKEEIEKLGMDFLSTPFDKTSVDFLEDLGAKFYKIASFELVDIPLIKYVASKGKPIIISTGMATIEEIEYSVNAIKEQGNCDIVLLRCSSAYPAIPDDMNLRTISDMSNRFRTPIGLSDHSLGSIGAITAIAVGAKVIEKHFCISREVKTPDSSFSMEFLEFKRMVEDIRATERALGNVSYNVSDSEAVSRNFRKSIFVIQNIKKGERLSDENIRVIRPANGLAPRHYNEVIGKTAAFDIERGTPLSWSMINE